MNRIKSKFAGFETPEIEECLYENFNRIFRPFYGFDSYFNFMLVTSLFVDNVVKMKNQPLKNGETEEERPPFDFRPVST